MCLSKVHFSMVKTKDEFVGVGYKLLRNIGGVLKGSDYLGAFKQDRWLKASNLDMLDYGYPLGFHLFLSGQDARKYDNFYADYVVAEFKFRKVVAFGENDINGGVGSCVVAAEMKFVQLTSF